MLTDPGEDTRRIDVAAGSRSSTRGRIASVHGPVVEVEFSGELPAIHEMLVVEHGAALEVHAQLDRCLVRTIALADTAGLKRGQVVARTRRPLVERPLLQFSPKSLASKSQLLGRGRSLRLDCQHDAPAIVLPDLGRDARWHQRAVRQGICQCTPPPKCRSRIHRRRRRGARPSA